MKIVEMLLSALLALYPGPNSEAIERNRVFIADQLVAAETIGVPPSLMIAVGFLETHLGTDYGEGGNWGAPAPGPDRSIAGTPQHAARALVRSFHVCGDRWQGGISRYRCGRCACGRSLVGYTTGYALHLAARLHEQTGLPLPANLH